ncbi:hypothetical protein [Streptomyces sp. NPDC056549]|uniref:hypothetical protein n=1 Tax=Streptomyces sp. NPDC056549 TaxID=3345864 RepID=UPI0036B66E92
MAIAAGREGDQLVMLLDPDATSEQISAGLNNVFGHLFANGLVVWTGGPQEPGIP